MKHKPEINYATASIIIAWNMLLKLKSRSKHIFEIYLAYKEIIRTCLIAKNKIGFVEKRVLIGLELK